jgi:Tfp pilus assembly protein PilV
VKASPTSSGFPLIEVLVGGFVVVLALLGVATMCLAAYGHLDRSGEQTQAVILGQQRIEWLRNQGYSSSAMSAGTTTEVLTGTYANYSRVTVVQDGTPRSGVKQISVTVTTPSGIDVQVVGLLADL